MKQPECQHCQQLRDEIYSLTLERAEAQASRTVLELALSRLEDTCAALATRLAVAEDLRQAPQTT